MKLSEIVKILSAEVLNANDLSIAVNNICIDSRTVQKGDLFVAIYGGKVDGHDFVQQAKENGAVAALVNREVAVDIPLLKIDQPIKALGKLGSFKRKQFTGKVIGITGSVGKTTTKTILASILAQHAETFSNIKSYNTDATLPLMLWQLKEKHYFAVLEMGASYFGEIAYLTEMAKPQVAVLLNAVPCHVENFGDLAGISRAKGEIFQGLHPIGSAILNLDDQYFDYWKKLALIFERKILSFGLNPKADVTASAITIDDHGCPHFYLHLPDSSKVDIALPLLGAHNVINALAASAAAFSLGLKPEEIKQGLETVAVPEMRLQQYCGISNAKIIDDSYNANPASVNAALKILAGMVGEKIFIFGDMRELGENTVKYHEDVGKLAKDLNIDYLCTFGELSAISAKCFGKNGFAFADQDALIAKVKTIINAQSVILIKGSRSMHMENVVQKLRACPKKVK